MVIEKVHGLQCTGITLGERFALIMAEHRLRVLRIRRRTAYSNQFQSTPRQILQPELRTWEQPLQQPIRQRLGMPGLRRFGSDGNLPGLQTSKSSGNFNQFRNRIPWRQSSGNLRTSRKRHSIEKVGNYSTDKSKRS